MKTLARVVSKKESNITVKFIRPEGECHKCGACSAFNFIPLKNSVSISLNSNNKEYKEGDIVILSALDRFYYIALLLAFIVPIFFLLGGAAIFSTFFNEAAGVFGGFALMFLYLFIGLRSADKYFRGIFSVVGKLDHLEDACSL